MGQRCKACGHPERAQLDAELALNRPLRALAKRFDVTIHSLSRHRRGGHIPKAVLALAAKEKELVGVDVERLRAQVGDGVVYALSRRRAFLDQEFNRAVVAQQPFAIAALGKEARAHDEALAKVCGELAPRVHQHLHVLATAEWGRIRGAILRRARQRPDLRAELLALLAEVEGEAPHLDGSPLRRAPPVMIEAAGDVA